MAQVTFTPALVPGATGTAVTVTPDMRVLFGATDDTFGIIQATKTIGGDTTVVSIATKSNDGTSTSAMSADGPGSLTMRLIDGSNGYAGYFADGSHTVHFADGTFSIASAGPCSFDNASLLTDGAGIIQSAGPANAIDIPNRILYASDGGTANINWATPGGIILGNGVSILCVSGIAGNVYILGTDPSDNLYFGFNGQSIFFRNNSTTHMTIDPSGAITTLNNTLDDGSGNATVNGTSRLAGQLTIAVGGGAPTPCPDSNAVAIYDTANNGCNVWFNLPTTGTNATLGLTVAGSFYHGITFDHTHNRLVLTNDGANGYPSTGVVIDANGNVGISTVATPFSDTLTVNGTVNVASLTASRAMASDANKVLVSSATTATELGYVSGVTSAIQTQLDGKQTLSTTQVTLTPNGALGAGTAVCSQPFQGSTYKKVIIYFNAYNYGTLGTNAQVYTFPTAFQHTPLSITMAGLSVTATVTTTAYTITAAAAQTGFVILEGY